MDKKTYTHSHTHTNGKYRFVLTTYYTTEIFRNVSCSKVHPSSKSTHPAKDCLEVEKVRIPLNINPLRLRGCLGERPPVFSH